MITFVFVVGCALFALIRIFVHVGFGMRFVVVKPVVFAKYSFVMLSCVCFWFGLLFRCVAGLCSHIGVAILCF